MPRWARCVLGLLCVVVPLRAIAQQNGNAIAGVARDPSGAVLPGVTVEVSSADLIEKVRSVATDSEGRYAVVDLRPGSYAVQFSLTGFKTIRRNGVELTGNFTATINAELEIGSVEESITVSAQSPLVDVQSVRQQRGVDAAVLESIPTARDVRSISGLIPGMVSLGASDVGGLNRGNASFVMHGGVDPEGRSQVDGFMVGGSGSGVASTYWADVANAQEVVVTTSGHLGEAETAGAIINIIPRQGGNTVRGATSGNFANGSMQGSNYTQALQDAGLRAPNQLRNSWEFTGNVGGPIKKDRLWYVGTWILRGSNQYIAGMYYNKNAGNPNSWVYEPDLTKQAFADRSDKSASVRLTWQATQRNKFVFFVDNQRLCTNCNGGGSATTSPEASGYTKSPQYLLAGSWTSPVTSRLLLDGGYQYGPIVDPWGSYERSDPNLISVTEQLGTIPNLVYRNQVSSAFNFQGVISWRASASYVTGSHNVKVGYIGFRHCHCLSNFVGNNDITYRFSNGVPNQVTLYIDRFNRDAHLTQNALFAQDSWTHGRLTAQGGVRYDRLTSEFPETTVGPIRFLPNAITFPETDGANLSDISPRMGLAYDLFGEGKTALKVELGRYLKPAAGSSYLGTSLAPAGRLAGSGGALGQNNSANVTTTRTWNDLLFPVGDPRRGNFVPDCDLLNPVGNDECGAMANQNFGKNILETAYDPDILSGWANRPSEWNFGASVQQQILPALSATVGFYRRWWNDEILIDNRAASPADYDPWSFTAPLDPRLPDGGGYLVSGLYDIKPTKFGQNDALVTSSEGIGNLTHNWQGVDITLNARSGRFRAQGGTSTGRLLKDECDLLPKIDSPTTRFCRVQEPLITRVQGLVMYTVPKAEVLVSGTVQSNPGPELQAIYNVPSSVAQVTLGRPLSTGATSNVAVNLIEPVTQYGRRKNWLDARVAKVFVMQGKRIQVGLDIYNLLNTDVVETYNNTFVPGGVWLRPTAVIPARFVRINGQIDF